jgi:hypothetical protein
MTFPLKIIGLLKSKVDDSFKFTINTALDTGDNFQLPLISGETYNFLVNWGDGNEDTITVYNQAETLHTYSSGGIYQVTITGECGGWSFNNGGDKLKITSVDNWGNTLFTDISEGFFGCSNLSSLAADGIKCTGTIGNSLFRACTSLTSLPQGLLDQWTALTNASIMFFGCTGLTGLPNDLFRFNTSIIAFALTFKGCIGITSLPNNLFFYNTLVTNYLGTLEDCRNMSLPSVLFDLTALSIVTTFNNMMNTGLTSYSNTGTVQDIWNYTSGSETHLNTFRNQTALSNYASIPNDWKGL